MRVKSCPVRSALARMADEPFRLFFPLGVLHCVIGVGYWPLRVFGLAFADTPSQFHTFLQVYGFMTAFVLGFLGTALPRLTEARRFSVTELLAVFAGHAATVFFIWAGSSLAAQIAFLATLVLFVVLLGLRFGKRKRNPPETFVFVPIAFLCAMCGAALLAGFYAGVPWLPLEAYDIGVALSFQAYILLLLIGVGGFLIRSILGWGMPLPVGTSDKLILAPWRANALITHLVAGIAIAASFWIEIFWWREAGLVIRALAVTAECLGQIKIHRRPVSGKLTSGALRVSLWLLMVGIWSPLIAPPQYSIGLMHFVLVGGFALSTFSVATRVILSHCGYGALLNRSYAPFSWAVGFMLFGVFVRVSADFIPQVYEHHLAYAGLMWILGLLIWSAAVLSKALRQTFAVAGAQGNGC